MAAFNGRLLVGDHMSRSLRSPWRTVFNSRHKRVLVRKGRRAPRRPPPPVISHTTVTTGGWDLGLSWTLCWQLLLFILGVYVLVIAWEYLVIGFLICAFLYGLGLINRM